MPISSTYHCIVYKGEDLPKQYEALIYSKWLRSLRYGNDYYKLIDQDSYFNVYHRYIAQLLAKPECEVRLAVLGDDYDCVLGFAVSRGDCLDYVHVHKDYRKTGVARSLTVFTDWQWISHLTRQGISSWNKLAPNAKFNPFY